MICTTNRPYLISNIQSTAFSLQQHSRSAKIQEFLQPSLMNTDVHVGLLLLVQEISDNESAA